MFTQEQLIACHWGWVLLLVSCLCCTEASIQLPYKGVCSYTYLKCYPNLLCKIILRKVWKSEKTNVNRKLCRHDPRAAFNHSICIVMLLWASFSLKLSHLLVCSYACNKMLCSLGGHVDSAELCVNAAAVCWAGADSQPAILGHNWGPHLTAFSEQRGGLSL